MFAVLLSLAADPRLPRDDLLLYRGPGGEPAAVKSPEDWAKRRAEVVRGMEAVMGKLPGDKKRCALDVKVDEEVDCGKYVRRLITYASEPGCRVPAYLLIPKDVLKGRKKAPAVLCLHGTDMTIGHGTVVGLGKRANRSYASELAERGHVTLAPNYPIMAKYQPDIKALGWESGTLKAVWDNMRGLDLLAALPFVDGERIGAIGHSLGGHNAVFTAVFDPRLKAVVSSCGLDSFLDYYKGDEKNWLPEKGWCQTRYMAKLSAYRGKLEQIPFDFHELIGALAPRHVLIVAPKGDSNFRADSVARIVKAARPVFKLLGHEKRLRVEHPDCPHDFPPAMRELAYRLFDDVLGVAVSAAKEGADGVLTHAVESPHQDGPESIRVLRPTKVEKGRAYRTLYVLPVEAGDGRVYGDGLAEVKKLGLHDKFGLVCVAPTFARLPWYADHPTDPRIAQEAHLLRAVLPYVEAAYPVRSEPAGRLLLGFSKSGWGAFTLLLRHPDVFGRAAAWDAPLMMDAPGKYGSGPIFGTKDNFEKYSVAKLLAARAGGLGAGKRLAVLGYGSFRKEHVSAHELMGRLRIAHEFEDGPARKHDWHSGWVKRAVEWLAE